MSTPEDTMQRLSDIIPVPVHIMGTNVPAATPAPPTTRRKASVLHTVTLSANNPIQDLLSQQADRCEAWIIQYGDADFVICHSQADANRVSLDADYSKGVSGTIVPRGCLVPVPCHTTDRVFVTANATDLAGGSPQQTVSVSNPAAGAQASYTIPAGSRPLTPESINWTLTTSAAVATRFMTLQIKDASGNVVMNVKSSGGVTATSVLQSYNSAGYGGAVSGTSGANQAGLPNITLYPGWTIQTAVAAMDAADQISNFTILSAGAPGPNIKIGVVEILYAKD